MTPSKLLGFLAIAGIVAVVLANLDDIRKYVRISTM
jgi:hypothetical protein